MKKITDKQMLDWLLKYAVIGVTFKTPVMAGVDDVETRYLGHRAAIRAAIRAQGSKGRKS